MITANHDAFLDPRYRMIAEGHDLSGRSDLWVDPQGLERRPITNGGMLNPTPYVIRRGTELYRYADASKSPWQNLGSPWWIERRDLDLILSVARRHQTSERLVSRLLLVMPPEWGAKLDLLVKVRVDRDLQAYRGLGKSAWADARDGGPVTRIEPRNENANLRIHQLYIPGVRSLETWGPSGRHEVYYTLLGTWRVHGASWIHV